MTPGKVRRRQSAARPEVYDLQSLSLAPLLLPCDMIWSRLIPGLWRNPALLARWVPAVALLTDHCALVSLMPTLKHDGE